jgi:hypothetical protein
VVIDATGRVAFMNAAAQVLTGWEPAAAQGKDVEAVVPLVTSGIGRLPMTIWCATSEGLTCAWRIRITCWRFHVLTPDGSTPLLRRAFIQSAGNISENVLVLSGQSRDWQRQTWEQRPAALDLRLWAKQVCAHSRGCALRAGYSSDCSGA